MKTEYYKRRVITHGDSIKHYPGGTSILMDMMITAAKEQCKKYRAKKVTK
jgi:hypothetical protein